MIRKNIKTVNIDYTSSTSGNVDSINNNLSNITSLDNYYNKSDELEIVDFSLDNSELNDYDLQIKNNNDNMEAMSKIEKELEKEYQSLKENIDNIYSLDNSELWYGNGIILSNGEKPMTPQDYQNMLLGDYSLIYSGENIIESFNNDLEYQEKIKTYKETYNEIFKKLTNGNKTEEEYQEYMESIKNDKLMICSSIYALKEEQEKLKIKQEEQKIILSDGFNKWNKTSLSIEELEANYNEYQEQYLRIYDVPDLAQGLQDNYNPMRFCEYAEKLAEEQGKDLNDVINRQVVVYQQDFQKINEDYQVMSTEEIAIFSYLFETEGRASAEKYLSKKQNELNQRIGMNKAQEEIAELSLDDEGKIKETLGNMLNVGTDGLGDGITSFFKGLENAIINNEKITAEEYKVAYYIQYLEQNSNYLDNIYQVGMATGNMLPSVTASFLTSLIAPELAPKVGQTLMGLSAYGNSKHEALTNNYSTTAAIIYGLLSASSEVLTEKMGGILGIADNPSSNFIIKMFQEGREEFIQSYLMAGIDAIVLNKEINLSELNNEAIKSFLMGAVVAGTLNAYSTALGNITFKLNNSEISLNNERINQVMEQIEKNPDIDIKDILTNINNEQSLIDKKYTRYEELMKYFKTPEFQSLSLDSKQKIETEFQSIVEFLQKYIDNSKIQNVNFMEEEITTLEVDEITVETNPQSNPKKSLKTSNQNQTPSRTEYINEINKITLDGSPIVIKIDDLNFLRIQDLEKIHYKRLVSFKMPNDEIISCEDYIETLSYMQTSKITPTDTQSLIEEGLLKDEILKTVQNKNYSEIEKIRKLYLELNKRVSYDPTYIYNAKVENGETNRNKIYNRKLSFNNINSNKVICKGWSELFQELLISAGIPSEQIHLVGGTKIGAHKWIEIDVPNIGTIVADATENIKGSNDLTNSKVGNRTSGFIIKPESSNGQKYRINFQYKNEENVADLDNRMNAWDEIDKVIGANIDGQYTSDLLKEAKDTFGAKTPNIEQTKNLLNSIFMANVVKDLSGLEYYNYIKCINNQIGNSARIKARFSFFNGVKGIDDITVLTFDGKYAAYSETYGKIVTNNRQKMVEYLKKLNVNTEIEKLI